MPYGPKDRIWLVSFEHADEHESEDQMVKEMISKIDEKLHSMAKKGTWGENSEGVSLEVSAGWHDRKLPVPVIGRVKHAFLAAGWGDIDLIFCERVGAPSSYLVNLFV